MIGAAWAPPPASTVVPGSPGAQPGTRVCVQPLVLSQASWVHASRSSQSPQLVHDVAPSAAYVPAAHAVQLAAPAAAKVPAPQAEHTEAPGVDRCPAAHGVQIVFAAALQAVVSAVPAAQTVHARQEPPSR